MNKLTANEILLFLELLKEKNGHGYSPDPTIAQLQAKLSIMLEVARKMEQL